MTMTFYLVGPPLSPINAALFYGGYLDLVPAGVGVADHKWILGSGGIPTEPIFGFDQENPFVSGFDVGYWDGQGGNTVITGSMLQSINSLSAILNVTNPTPSIVLLHLDGTNGSSTVTDVYTPTFSFANPSGVISTSTYALGGASAFLGTSPFSLIESGVSYNNLLSFGTTDFTVEFWVNSTSSNCDLISQVGGGFAFGINSSGYMAQGVVGSFSGTKVGNSAINDGNWHALAYARKSGVGYLFVDGVIEWTGTDTTNYTGSGGQTFVGYTGGGGFTGYIDELRISPVARYTTNYTPANTEFTY
jgi:hypothetical protein